MCGLTQTCRARVRIVVGVCHTGRLLLDVPATNFSATATSGDARALALFDDVEHGGGARSLASVVRTVVSVRVRNLLLPSGAIAGILQLGKGFTATVDTATVVIGNVITYYRSGSGMHAAALVWRDPLSRAAHSHTLVIVTVGLACHVRSVRRRRLQRWRAVFRRGVLWCGQLPGGLSSRGGGVSRATQRRHVLGPRRVYPDVWQVRVLRWL